MKRILLSCVLIAAAFFANAQTTYYWVGNAGDSINVTSNWNTSKNSTGTFRPTNSDSTDVLIFDSVYLTTGVYPVTSTAGINCAQLKITGISNLSLNRSTGGTSTIRIAGDYTVGTEDFLVESGNSFGIANGPGSVILSMGNLTNSGRVSGNFSMITGFQAGIRNTLFAAGILVFTNSSTFTTNITASSAAYAFGNSTQSTEKWVTFQAGSTCYYDGGFSVMASSSTFQPVNFLPGSRFVVRASNPTSGFGTFTNRKGYANVIIQNGATFTADGPANQIDTLTIANGSTFTTHTSGQTVILGDLVVHGMLTAPANSSNEVVMAGSVQQTISGTGSITIPTLTVTDGANVVLGKTVSLSKSAVINGKIDFGTNQLTGAGTFTARSGITTVAGTGNTISGAYLITGVTGANGLSKGISVSGAGLQPNTRVISFTTNFDSVYVSRQTTATANNVALSFSAGPATLTTSNPLGFDPVNGSVAVADVKSYNAGINYIINATTSYPFGISTVATSNAVSVNNVQFNAPATTNGTARILGSLQATSGKITIRPLDTLWLFPGATLNGTYNNSTYFVTDVNASGDAGVFRRDNVTGSNLFPIGSSSNYLPATLNPVTASDFAVNVFQGITTNGTPTGTPLTSLQKQTVVDAVWNVNRVNGSGDANLKLQWTPVLEGTTLATFANSEIGIIKNTGSAWSLPFGIGDNAANTADTLFSSFGQFSVGARPPANPFVFNALPPKTYGNPDFSPGVISSNTTQPITYTSSNPAVATIVGGNIHIIGVGTTTITSQQASDGFYPAANVSQTLTVAKAPLTIKADRKIKPEGDPNPPLTATYTGFVLGETQSVLLTPVVLSTTATTSSAPGNYLITVSGATATNYAITFVNDSLIVKPRTAQTITFPAFPTKTYGNPNFGIGATSTNNTIPITYVSSNTNVATIVGNNIHIVGAGTTTITASQAGSDLFFPAADVSQTLTVNKAPLTIRVADTIKMYGQPNPAFRLIYTGFVLGETSSVLTTQPTISTTAATTSAPGYYSLDPIGAVAANYNITTVSGRLTIYPANGTDQANLQAFVSNGSTLSVRVYSPTPDLGDIFIYDMSGRPMARKNIFIAPGFVTAYLGIGNMPSGIYVVQVIGKNGTKLKLTIPIIH